MLMSIENCKEGIMLRFTDRIQRSHDLSQYLSILTPLTHKVNSDFYEHYVHIIDSKKMDKMVLRGDMDITFAGLVDRGK